jgi:hypothetical protein
MGSLHTDLLQQANDLINKEPKRPKQASLRRAVSAAYYALFHLLTDEASRLLVSGSDRFTLRQWTRRAFSHTTMKKVSNDFSRPKLNTYSARAGAGEVVPDDLRQVAKTFVALQEARHLADYDHLHYYSRNNARDFVQEVERAFAAWRQVRSTPVAELYLVSLLAQGTMRG